MADTKSEGAKPVSSTRKMVAEADLIAVKKRAEKAEADAKSYRGKVTQLESELKVAKMTEVTDEDVKEVRDFLLKRETELNELKAQIEERETALQEREKGSRVEALAAKYGLDVADLLESDDPEKRAYELYIERLTSGKEKKEEPEEKKTPEEVFETHPAGGTVKKQPKDMTDEEFTQFEKELKASVVK